MSVPRSFGVVLAMCIAVVCGGCEKPAPRATPAPPAEFLLAAGDSTYWVRSGEDGVHVRSAPILLTRADGKFYEVFITDDVHDYEQASFASARAFRRDITQDDSLLIYADSTVLREALRWQRAHPMAVPLDPSDEEPDQTPPTLVTDDIEVIDVHGPWLSFLYSLNVDVAGRANHVHKRQRGVLDIRTGTRATLATLFGATQATIATGRGRYGFEALRDSIANSKDSRGAAARPTLRTFAFDSMSFGLTDIGLAPAVAFEVAGTAGNGEALSLYLPPYPLEPPEWWHAVAPTLPHWSTDSSLMVWDRTGYRVTARPAVNGNVIFVSLEDVAAKGKAHSWAVAAVSTPAYQLIPLDVTPLDSTTRNALSRAFDQSTALDGTAKQAGFHGTQHPTMLSRAGLTSRTTIHPACPISPLRHARMSSLPFASRTSVATSSACLPSRSASRFRAP